MKKIIAIAFAIVLATSAFALGEKPVKRESVIDVTATTTATTTTTTCASGTCNEVTVQNTGTVAVRITPVSNDDNGSDQTDYATGKIHIPAGQFVTITNELVTGVRHAAASGTSALVIEYGRKIR